MGMTGQFLRVSNDDLETYFLNSNLLSERMDASYTGDPEFIDIDKAWEGILFLLTGSGIAIDPHHPLAKIIMSENVVDEDQNFGFGPATYVTPEEVIQLSKELTTIDRAELTKRYNPVALNEAEIYPQGWDDEEMLEYVLENYDTLKQFYADAAANGQAIVSIIN
ncbi:MAG: YfbM family protein [Chitinophagaceae bacterium]